MFENRKLTVTVDKKDKNAPDVIITPDDFEEKLDLVLHKLEKFGRKLFVGVAAYVVLDTWRQVTVEKANGNHR